MNLRSLLVLVLALTTFPTLLRAQAVPAGSILWLSAEAGIDSVNGQVATWRDQSGHGHHAVQNDPARQPTLHPNAFQGKPALHFGGNSFFSAPSIFPASHDYSLSAVLSLDDTARFNNILSGATRALWFDRNRYLNVHHLYFGLDAIASRPIRAEGSVITVTYSSARSTAKLYVNGRLLDSLWLLPNTDTLVYIGAYTGSYCLQGDLAQLLLYDRSLTDSEVYDLDAELRGRYGIPADTQPDAPRDSTFRALPAPLQFFPRDGSDSGSVHVAGTLRAPGFDTVTFELYREGQLLMTYARELKYSSGDADFEMLLRLHAELSEYAVRVSVSGPGRDSLLAYRDHLVCGDAYIMSGQSNALIAHYGPWTKNRFCRTFGVVDSHNIRDTLWEIAQSDGLGVGPEVGAWGFELQSELVEALQVPICVISGATPGGYIEDHTRNDQNPLDMSTAYGRLLHKLRTAHLDSSVRALIWYQGEWNTDWNYAANFHKLHNDWLKVYPRLQQTYVVQIRPVSCNPAKSQLDLKELQRNFQKTIPQVVSVATAAIPGQNGCHFEDYGYEALGRNLAQLLLRDIYGKAQSPEISSPDLVTAAYTPDRKQIILTFEPAESQLRITNDTLVNGKLRTMKDFFYLDDSSGLVTGLQAKGNTVTLDVSAPAAHTITYLPDHEYPDGGIYEGPWIVNGQAIGALIFAHVPLTQQLAVTAANGATVRAFYCCTKELRIERSGDLVKQLTLYDAVGRRVFEHELSGTTESVTIDLSQLPRGLYRGWLETLRGTTPITVDRQ